MVENPACITRNFTRASPSPGQPAEVKRPQRRRVPLQILYERRHRLEADPAGGLLDIDRSGKRSPASRLIEFEIVRLAKKQRELRRVVVAHGTDRRVDRDAGKTLATAIGTCRDLANA